MFRLPLWIVGLGLAAALPSCEVAPQNFVFERRDPPLSSSTGPYITLMLVAPVQTDVGGTITLSGNASGSPDGKVIKFKWTGQGGTIDYPDAHSSDYVCRDSGEHRITLTVTDLMGRHDALSTTVTCF